MIFQNRYVFFPIFSQYFPRPVFKSSGHLLMLNNCCERWCPTLISEIRARLYHFLHFTDTNWSHCIIPGLACYVILPKTDARQKVSRSSFCRNKKKLSACAQKIQEVGRLKPTSGGDSIPGSQMFNTRCVPLLMLIQM